MFGFLKYYLKINKETVVVSKEDTFLINFDVNNFTLEKDILVLHTHLTSLPKFILVDIQRNLQRNMLELRYESQIVSLKANHRTYSFLHLIRSNNMHDLYLRKVKEAKRKRVKGRLNGRIARVSDVTIHHQ